MTNPIVDRRRAFFIECSGPQWIVVLKELVSRHGWRPILWTGASGDLREVETAFPGISVIAGVDAARGRRVPQFADATSPADGPLLEALAPAETIALAMMERMDPDGHTFGHDERRWLYIDILSHWSAVLDRLAPDVVVFSISPHIVFDYVLYELCKHRGIRTLMFERMGAPGRLLPIERFEDGSAALRNAYSRYLTGPTPDLPGDLEKYLKMQEADPRQSSPNFVRKVQRFGLNRSRMQARFLEGAKELWRFTRLVLRGAKAPETYLKARNRPIVMAPSLLAWQLARLAGLGKKRRLRRVWSRLSTNSERAGQYVYVPMHFQPERATIPAAGVLYDQTLMVDLIVQSLPQNWRIVVREHPWQLAWFSRGEMARSEDYYLRLCRDPRVSLAPQDADPEALLKGASAVATMTGSLGWQALCRRVPVLLFGAAWYRDVDGAFAIRSRDDVTKAFARILDGFRPDPAAPRALLAAIAEVSCTGVLEVATESIGTLSLETAGRSMADALADSMP